VDSNHCTVSEVSQSDKTGVTTTEGTVKHCQSKEANMLWSYQEETMPGKRNNARNNARYTQARKTTHGLDRQHQDVDSTPCGKVSENDRG